MSKLFHKYRSGDWFRLARLVLDGAEELNDGMIEFNDEGIQKLMDLFGDNVTDMLDRLDAIQKTGASYQTFSGKSDDMHGSVKFILKTGEIKSDE